MTGSDRPRLRPYINATPENEAQSSFVLTDHLRLSPPLRLNPLELHCVSLFNGERTLRDIQTEVIRLLNGRIIPLEHFHSLVELLDQTLYLDTERYHSRAHASVRAPCCIGVYPEDPELIRRQFHQLFTHPQAAGLPQGPLQPNGLRAILAPHIDYARGGLSYTFAFKELVERTDASLFVIVGTSHYAGNHRFTLTRKDFQTPLGIVSTDQRTIDRLVAHYGDGLFEGELIAHLPEHSIELEVVLLQYLLADRRDLRIVPLVVGSFQDCIEQRQSPQRQPDIQRMVRALQAVERETQEPICYVISGDLAHIGPKFDDPEPVSFAQLEHSKRQDYALLKQAAHGNSEGYFSVVADEGDERRICGLSPTWLVLAATQVHRGELLHYGQYAHPRGYESVSFASMAFYK